VHALVARAKKRAAESGTTLTAVIEVSLREALERQRTRERSAPVELPVYGRMGLQPGVLLDDSAELLNLMAPPRRAASRR